jgi:hypothetical protein
VIGQSSPILQQSLSNFGTDALSLTVPLLTSDPHFVLDAGTTTCGTTIIADSTCNLGIIFTPTDNGLPTASLPIKSNSYNSPQSIQLTGTGKLVSSLQFTLPAETEVYGQPFSETVDITSSSPAPTGTITFNLGAQTLCTLTATLGLNTACIAANSGLSVGTYTVSFSYSGDTNYNAATGSVTLTVTPAPLIVVVDNFSRPYGTANPTLTGTLTGVVPTDTILISYTTSATLTSPVGSYPITATLSTAGATSLSNYSITNTQGTLTITPVSLTVNVLDATRQYGQANPSFNSATFGVLNNGTIAAGTLNGDILTISYSTTATITSPVGPYPINATISGARSGNYTITILPGTLTVLPATLFVTVDDASRVYDTANPVFTSTVRGAVNGDTFTITYTTTATTTSPVGNYTLIPSVSGPAAANTPASRRPTERLRSPQPPSQSRRITLPVVTEQPTQPSPASHPAYSTVTP